MIIDSAMTERFVIFFSKTRTYLCGKSDTAGSLENARIFNRKCTASGIVTRRSYYWRELDPIVFRVITTTTVNSENA